MISSNSFSMNHLMTFLTERYPVRHNISEFGIFLPGLYVMSMYFSILSAFSASIMIADINGFGPLFIFISSSFFGSWLCRYAKS